MELVWISKIWNCIFYHRFYCGYFLDKFIWKLWKMKCCAGFSTFNKTRKVLSETGLRYPFSVLWLGCTRLIRFITPPRCSLGSPYFPLQNFVWEYLSTGASRSQGTLECHMGTIKQEMWIEYLDGRNMDFLWWKNKENMNDNFFY